MNDLDKNIPVWYNDVCQIIDGTQARIATTVNAEVCWMNWHIGKRITVDAADYLIDLLFIHPELKRLVLST